MKKSNRTELDDLKLTSEERYDFFVEQVFDQGEMWSLFGNGGWVLLSSGEDSCIPFWPSAAIAKAMSVNEWQNCEPKQIDLQYWKDNWVIGMQQDKVLAAIFPNQQDNGTIDHPEDLLLVLEAMS